MFKKIKSLLFVMILLCFFVSCNKTTESKNKEKKENTTDKSINLVVSETNSEKKIESDSGTKEIKETKESKIKKEEKLLVDGKYYKLEEVVKYLKTYNKLPVNYITKEDAKKLGWDNKEGNLWEVTDKMVIGGDRFGNREGKLPKAKKRNYFEADIDYKGGFRNPKRIVYSNDGLIFYTEDHYNSFERID